MRAGKNRWENFTLGIWNSRAHECQCCEKPLNYPIRTYYFSHVLGKGAWPIAKWWKENILLMCWECHQEWDFGKRDQLHFKGANILRSTLIQTCSFFLKNGYIKN